MATRTRAAVYTRVSSTGQGDNYSLPTQEAACRAFAADRGWDISGVYTDVHTRTELWERTQLSALREAVRQREIDAVICYAIDRLSGDPVHLGVILTEADHAGIEIVFVTEPLDDSPEGQLIRFVRGYAAKVEHEKIKERTQRGKRARIESGKPAVGPRPPYGFCWVDDRDRDGKSVKLRLEENPDTSWVVRRIYSELAGGTSARQVGLRLSAEGVPTPTGKAQWVTATITQMVQNPVYAGDARAGRYHRERVKGQGGKGWRYTRLDATAALPLPGVAPALVSSELAAAVLSRLAVNKQESIRNNRHPEAALLRGGYAVCGYCGGHLQAITHRTNGTTYRCNQTNRDAHGCPAFSMQAHLLDAEIWRGVQERLLDPKLIAAELGRLKNEDPVVDDLAALERRATEVSRRQRNLMVSLAKEDNPDVAAMIRADLATLLSEQRAIEDESAALERQRDSWQQAQEHLHELDRWIGTVATNLDTLDYEGKRLALNASQVQVRVWATNHAPRWQATMHLGGATPMSFVDTTIRGCTRCSRWRSHGE